MRILFGGKRKSRRRRSRRRSRRRTRKRRGRGCPSGESWDAVAGKCMPFDSVSGYDTSSRSKVISGGRRRRRSRRRKSRRRRKRRR